MSGYSKLADFLINSPIELPPRRVLWVGGDENGSRQITQEEAQRIAGDKKIDFCAASGTEIWLSPDECLILGACLEN